MQHVWQTGCGTMSKIERIRLDRLLAQLTSRSRNEVRALVKAGRVVVDGSVATDAAVTVTQESVLWIDGVQLDTRREHHLMLNKPSGVLTAAEDSRQKTVMDLLPAIYSACRCMPVGRLDKDTEGLLLFTTDGQLNHRLLSPKRSVPKVYHVTVEGMLTESVIETFHQGVQLKDFLALPAKLQILEASERSSRAIVTVFEGKYHQVKRMFGACGFPVIQLKRTSFGSLLLDPALNPGDFRELTTEELKMLREEAGFE